MRVQCFPPTCYVMGGATRAHINMTWRPLPDIVTLEACLQCMALQCSVGVLCRFTDSFICLVSAPCYALSRKRKFVGELGVVGDIIFIWARRMGWFDSRLRILWHFEVPPCLYREAIHLQSFPPTHAHTRDDLYQFLSKLKFKLPACVVWLYYATMWRFPDNFFLLSV